MLEKIKKGRAFSDPAIAFSLPNFCFLWLFFFSNKIPA